MRYLLFLLALLTPSPNSFADTRIDKIQTLMDALGLVDTWKQQLALGEAATEDYGQQAMDQMLSKLNPNEEYKKRFSNAFTLYMEKISTPWTAEEIVDTWARFYGSKFSDSELDQLIAFYTSELGKKDVAVSKTAMTEFTNYYNELGKPIFEKATAEYIEDLKIIATECKCTRREP